MSRPRLVSDQIIFDGVYEALCQLGYAQLTLEKIAMKIGISPATLSKRFGSKKNLLLQYSSYVLEQTKQSFELTNQTSYSFLEKLQKIFMQMTDLDVISLANITSLYLAGVSDPELNELSRKRLQLIDLEVQKLLDQAIAANEMKPCDTPLISRVLLSSLTGTLFVWMKESNNSSNLKNWINDCFTVILHPYKE